MQSYFGYFGHACSHSPKMIVSSCGRLQYLSACKIWTASFTFFLRYYILKNLAVWLAGSILAITRDPKFCQICWSNINHNISSRFRLFPRKTNITKFFKQYKTSILGLFWTLFAQIWANMNFPEKKRAYSVFQYSNYLSLCQKSKQRNETFWKTLLDGQTKNLFIPLISLRDTVSFRVLRLIEKSHNYDWPRAFWAISQEPEFSQIWNLLRHIAITVNINFHYRPNRGKIKELKKKTKLSYI